MLKLQGVAYLEGRFKSKSYGTYIPEEVGHDLECFPEECLRARKKRKVIQKLQRKVAILAKPKGCKRL